MKIILAISFLIAVIFSGLAFAERSPTAADKFLEDLDKTIRAMDLQADLEKIAATKTANKNTMRPSHVELTPPPGSEANFVEPLKEPEDFSPNP